MRLRSLSAAAVALILSSGVGASAEPGSATDCIQNPTAIGCTRIDEPVEEPQGWSILGSHQHEIAIPANHELDDTPTTSMLEDIERFYPRNCAINSVDQDGQITQTLECYPDEEVEPQARINWVATMAQQYQRLTLTPSQISYQPEGDWALVNMDFIVLTDPTQQTLTTQLFGVDITVRSTPVHYQWDFGDGTTLATSDPGTPYPNHTLSHVYTQASDGITLTLTTSWRGEFQIAGTNTWIPIAGLATTTSTTAPIEIVTMDVHLVPNP